MKLLQDSNEINRQVWLEKVLSALPKGAKILDAGAGELKNRKYCAHLEYVSQDFCQYEGGESEHAGLQSESWDTSRVDIVCDICSIPEADSSFDAILCSEVLEHIPEPMLALDEFRRLLKPRGTLIITAPFASNVHMAPYHYCTGFSKYWYEHHLKLRGFRIDSLVANGDWYELLRQEIKRLGGMERERGNWSWPLAYLLGILGLIYFVIRSPKKDSDLACFGWQCVAVKQDF